MEFGVEGYRVSTLLQILQLEIFATGLLQNALGKNICNSFCCKYFFGFGFATGLPVK